MHRALSDLIIMQLYAEYSPLPELTPGIIEVNFDVSTLPTRPLILDTDETLSRLPYLKKKIGH